MLVGEPSVSDTIQILRGISERYASFHGVRIQDRALVAAAELSDRYITARFVCPASLKKCSVVVAISKGEPVMIYLAYSGRFSAHYCVAWWPPLHYGLDFKNKC